MAIPELVETKSSQPETSDATDVEAKTASKRKGMLTFEEMPEEKEDPLNRDGVIRGQTGYGINRNQGGFSINNALKIVKKSPEVISLVTAVVDDILSDYNFKWVGRKNTPGTRRIRDSEQFFADNEATLQNALIDLMFTGDMYVWKRRPSNQEEFLKVKSIIEERYSFNRPGMKERAQTWALKQVLDENERADDLKLVPSSTMSHRVAENGDIIEFIQRIGGEEVRFAPEQIIHMDYFKIDGGTYGFPPLKAILAEMSAIANVKDHNSVLFSNAGVQNKIWKLADAGPDDQNYKLLKHTLEKFQKLENKYTDLVVTGNVDVENMSDITSDMNFRELGEYLSRVIMMFWGVPPSRVGIDVAGGEGQSRASNLSQRGYYKKITRLQRRFSNVLNTQLWRPVFNTEQVFNNPDRKAMIRQTELERKRIENVKNLMQLGLISRDAAAERIGLRPQELPSDDEAQELMDVARNAKGSRNNSMSGQDVEEEPADSAINSDKQGAG